jgi:carbohydrate kinase (thermoresistant glucokinase family)
MVIVIMGVSGAGKTTIGRLLGESLGWPFRDGDDLHGAEARAKMHRREPLSDADRAPWLERIRSLIDGYLERGDNAVIACSALKRAYRVQLRADPERVKFVYLRGSYETIAARLEERREHFMPPELLRSQFDTLEEPTCAIVAAVDAPPRAIVADIIRRIGP